jgi:hypothetical protein
MLNSKRREFLRRSSMLAVAGALTACGGGTGSGTEAAAASGSLASTSDTTATPVISATTTALATGTPLADANFTLRSASAQSRGPFCLGYSFQRGDVPAGKTVAADAGVVQVIPKNTWPDGSLKFAVIAGMVDLVANTPKTVNLSVIPATTANPLTTARLRATNAVAEISADGYGTARWEGADWDTPFATWVAGPVMASWIYRRPLGSDPHLVAWLEVRVWGSGVVEVLPWIENGYLRVAAPTNKSTRYTFTLGGTQRFAANIDLKHHQRTPLISGSALSYWLGSDTTVIPAHNKQYLQASELVPTYLVKVDSASAVVKALAATYQPLQAGNFNYDQDAMASSGYQDPIGLLPQHDVLYLTSDAPEAYGAVVRNGFSAGRWGIHYRDENTNRPLRFSSYPNLNIGDSQGFKDTGGSTRSQYTPTPTGGNPPQWDVAHSPAVGYMAYLLTGRFYFMEEVQFATTANYLGNGDNNVLRDGAKGLVQPCYGAWQTRSCAWDWRARVHALSVTPDDDTALRAEFIASVEANIAHFHGRYIAQPNNPFGWVKSAESYDGTLRQGAPWQQDFVTAAFGYSVSLGLPVSSAAAAKLGEFFQWKAKSAVMRLGAKSGFWYINAVPYNMPISPASKPDYDNGTGPWYASDAEVYAATYAVLPAWMGKLDGTLAGEIMPGERALWGNLMPAIAYAVRHGVPGALDAFNRMIGAGNFNTLRTAFNEHPVWAVQPARMTVVQPTPVPVTSTSTNTSGMPSWLVGAAIGQWVEISGTAGAGGAAVHAYSGMAYNEQTNEILIAGAGGHGDSVDNRVVSLQLMADNPAWTLRAASSTNVKYDVPYYPDGKPISRHLYSSIHYIPQLNRVMLFGVTGAAGNAYSFDTVDAFDLDTNSWDPAGTWANTPFGERGSVSIRATGEVWTNNLSRWSPATKTWTKPITKRTNDQLRWPIAHDTRRNQLFTLNWADGMGYSNQALFASVVPCAGSVQSSISFNPSAAVNSFIADKPTYSAMDYDPENDRFLFYCGQGTGAGRVYVITPNAGLTWDMSLLPINGAKLPPATPDAGVHSRFRYVPALRGFVLMPTATSNLFFIRTA